MHNAIVDSNKTFDNENFVKIIFSFSKVIFEENIANQEDWFPKSFQGSRRPQQLTKNSKKKIKMIKILYEEQR